MLFAQGFHFFIRWNIYDADGAGNPSCYGRNPSGKECSTNRIKAKTVQPLTGLHRNLHKKLPYVAVANCQSPKFYLLNF